MRAPGAALASVALLLSFDAAVGAKKPSAPASVLAELKVVGQAVAGDITDKKFEDLFAFLCKAHQARTTKQRFGGQLRELHRLAGTTTAELVKDDDIVYENRRAGAKALEDLEKLPSVLVPIRLHAADGVSSVQDWSFHRENGRWCTPLDD